ncbi:MAG: alpha/beta hydrolase [Bacteroidota bacterium]
MENFIQISKKARYWTLGNPNSNKILYVLHGYGQLAEYFIKNFETLADLGYFIVAPEGTQRFYLNGTSGRVGASWMTKELREIDIEENLAYLDLLHKEISKNKNYNSVSLLGFSQGGATAARWKAKTEIKFSKFVLWACVFPDDVKINFDELKQDECQKSFVVGNQDEYFNASMIQEISEFYKKLNFEVFLFDGMHKIDLVKLLLIFKNE